MKKIQSGLSHRMKGLRKEHGYSQATLAEMVGTAPNYISQIEQGNKFPSPTMLEKISTALEVHSYELFLPPKDESFAEIEKQMHVDIHKIVKNAIRKFSLLIEKK